MLIPKEILIGAQLSYFTLAKAQVISVLQCVVKWCQPLWAIQIRTMKNEGVAIKKYPVPVNSQVTGMLAVIAVGWGFLFQGKRWLLVLQDRS